MSYRITADSSSNMFSLEGVDFSYAPLKIITKEKEYIDGPGLDVAQMVEDLRVYKGTSGSSCPNAHDWRESFGDAENVFAITISSNLSGSYNAVRQAGEDYMEEHPGRKVSVLDSLSAGPELRMIAEKLREGIQAGKSFEEIDTQTRAYMTNIQTLFALQSLNNLARNGRVNPAVAKIAGVLGICVVGKASDVGTLEQLHKCRGEKRAIDTFYAEMKNMGYAGGKVCMSHCLNEGVAGRLEALIRADYPDAEIFIEQTTALCSFYAEKDGLIVGFETAQA